MKKYLILTSLILLMLIGYMLAEPFWLKATNIAIKSSDIPAGFAGKRIVFISDIHWHKYYFSTNRINRLVKKINAENPDIVILGGDYLFHRTDNMTQALNVLGTLTPKMGTYAVLGNHDYKRTKQWAIDRMTDAGIKPLNNSSFWIENGSDRIKIGGVGDPWYEKPDIAPTINDINQKDFSILVSHNPDLSETADLTKIDLMLSGHTHGGQVTLFGLWAPFVPSNYGNKLRYGLKTIGNTKLYISSGIGTEIAPIRFFARPEIVNITLEK